MKKLGMILGVASLVCLLATGAQATLISFGEVPLGASNPTIGGTSFWAGDPGSLYDTYTADGWSSGNPYLASGTDDGTGRSPGLYNSFIGVTLPSNTYSVSFDILSEKGIPDPTTLWVKAFFGGVLQGSTSLTVQDNDYHLITLNLGSDIDKLYIFDDLNSDLLGESFHIDNFDSTTGGGGAPVPEPSTLLLLASGLVGAVCWKKKTSRS